MRSVEENLLQAAQRLLKGAIAELASAGDRAAARLAVLEAVASVHAGWHLGSYWDLTGALPSPLKSDPMPWADKILASIAETEIPVSLALAALSREEMTAAKKRTTGAYHTDWRLAEYLAGESVRRVAVDGLWVDPACGAGMLLAAAALVVPEGAERDQVIRERLCGMDLSKQALRGALLSVASLSSDLAVASGFRDRLFCLDSLRSREVWQEIAPHGFALVIGNPPWERLKTSRHEVAASSGVVRHYGQSHQTNVDVTAPRAELLKYLEQIVAGTRLQGSGEHDLYKLFLELGLGLAADNGILAMLVPAGLIRAQGTNTLRKELDSLSRDLHISVIENRRRHFAIDTRFKFLAAISRVGQGTKQPISLKVADRAGVLPKIPVRIDRKELCEIRTDLTVPEVRTAEEWRLFAHLSRIGLRIGDPNGPWNPTYSREVDMTNDRNRFHRQRVEGSVAVIEGRHIAQFRSRAKSYQRGEGRAAIWQPQALENAELVPQWFIKLSDVRGNILNRIEKSRIGFCDITGQTNERSLLAARIPAGVVCGNKVPTLAFGSRGPEVEDLFLAVANSFAADWMLRRLITTSVNFFVLSSLPLPPIDVHSSIGRELVKLARLLTASEGSLSADLRQIGEWRARIDACVAVAWGIGPEQMRLMLDDFPLLDRGQPALPGEAQSTITRDSVLLAMSQDGSEEARAARCRVEKAMREGAIPYIPAEFV